MTFKSGQAARIVLVATLACGVDAGAMIRQVRQQHNQQHVACLSQLAYVGSDVKSTRINAELETSSLA